MCVYAPFTLPSLLPVLLLAHVSELLMQKGEVSLSLALFSFSLTHTHTYMQLIKLFINHSNR